MPTTVYLIRHGESLGNVRRIFLGHTDWDLTELGHRQAACTAEIFRDIPVDAILSSDLLRACHTASPIAAQKNLPIETDRGFREIFAGQWEGREFSDLEVRFAQDYTVWKTDIGRSHPTGGETVLQLHERVHDALLRAVRKHAGQTIVIATHATPIRVLLTGISGRPIEEAAGTPWVSNASVTKLEYENGEFRIVYSDRHDHLGDLSTRLPANV